MERCGNAFSPHGHAAYTRIMSITIDPSIEQRIQRQLDRGVFSEASELLAHAMDLIEAEENWLVLNREAINTALDESFAQAARGEGYTLEQAKAILAERRASRPA